MSTRESPLPVAEGDEAKGPSKNELKKKAKEAEKAKKAAERAAREAEEKARRDAANVDTATENYGKLPLHQSKTREGRKHIKFTELNKDVVGEIVLFRARLNTSRAQGSKMVFLSFRQQVHTLQGVLELSRDSSSPHQVSKQMLKFASSILAESIVLVEGELKIPVEEIRGSTVKDVEVHVRKIHVQVEVPDVLPILLDAATRPEPATADDESTTELPWVKIDTRLDNRVIDLRTTTSQAIFRIQSGVCQLFREFLNARDFIEIHTPKLQGAATESGASVFKLGYFKGNAFLAQSPQLAKQMCIAGDMERVYEIAPVFRAENSLGYRHMTEFTGLDLEMAIEEHYHEVIDLLEALLLFIFKGIKQRYEEEIKAVRKQYPSEDFLLPETGAVRLTFAEGVAMLKAVDATDEDGNPIGEMDDLSTRNEKLLGKLVREKYHTDFFILDKFPLSIRPFYTMPDPENPVVSNSYDFFMRGEEILSGAQRIHDAPFLIERMKAHGVDPASMQSYVDAFRFGAPPHGGAGLGLERIVMFFLKLGNIRLASLFPRDPKRLLP